MLRQYLNNRCLLKMRRSCIEINHYHNTKTAESYL